MSFRGGGVFLFFLGVSFLGGRGGFKGQVSWPKGPPHLALNPSYFFGLFSFFIAFFASRRKNLFFLPKKGHVCLFFSVSLCLSLAFCFLFNFAFSLFLSVSLLFFSFFLPSFPYVLPSSASLFLSLCFFALFLCFCFMKRATSKYQIRKIFFINHFCFFVSCFHLSFKSLSLIYFS